MMLRTLLFIGVTVTACARINYGVPGDGEDDDGGNTPPSYTFAFADGIPSAATFTRGSPATFIDASGSLVVVPSDTPRFVSSGNGGQALLIEGEGHNELANSRFELGLAAWEIDNVTSDEASVVPGGLLQDGGHHFQLRRGTGDPDQGLLQNVPTLRDEPHTVSFVARGVGACTISLAVDGLFVGSPVTLTATAARYSITFTPTSTDTVNIGLYCRGGPPVGDGFDLSHVQLEAGFYASSIIINDASGGSARRAPDRVVASVPDSPNATVGFRGHVDAVGDRSCLACLTASGEAPALVLDAEPSAPVAGFVTYVAAAAEALVDSDGAIGASVKALASTDGFNVLVARDGTTGSEDVLGTVPTFDKLLIGALDSDLPFDAVVRVEQLFYRDEVLSEVAAATATAP